MMRLIESPELHLYCERSYLAIKRLKVKYAEALSKCFVLAGLGQHGVAFVNPKEYEPAAGIMQRLGQQWFARDCLEELEKSSDRARDRVSYPPSTLIKSEYYFASFIIFTKSTFDFIAHLINQILKLDYHGKDIDLARAEFRKRIVSESPQLGEIINRQGSWIVEISKYRKAIEHQKVVPLTYVNPDDIIKMNQGKLFPPNPEPPLQFTTVPLSFSELMSEAVQDRDRKSARYKTKEVLPYCDLSLRKTQEIVEKTFEITYEILQESKAVKQFRRAREEAIRSSRESMEVGQLESLGEIESTTLEQYLKSKFPKRETGIAVSSASIVNLLSGLQSAEIRSYRELDRAIDDKMGWFLNYELKHPLFVRLNWDKPNEARKRGEYNAIGIVSRILQEILSEKHRLQRDHQRQPTG